MPELEKFGVDCLLGLDSIDHKGDVTVRRRGASSTLLWTEKWVNDNPGVCCGGWALE